MFSREISDGDTLLAGEMVGVDEGLVIQELSRPEELEKLQHELAKQVSKLAELGELKWLTQLEVLETEELQGMKGRIEELEKDKIEEVKEFKEKIDNGKTPEEIKLEWVKDLEAKKIQAVKAAAKKEAFILGELTEADGSKWAKVKELWGSKQPETIKDLGGLVQEVKELEEKWVKELGEKKLGKKFQGQLKPVKELKHKLDELAAIKALGKDKVEELGDLERLEAKKLEEVAEQLKDKVKVGALEGNVEALEGKLAEIEKIKVVGKEYELAKKLEELGGSEGVLGGIKAVRKLRELKEELAAIRALKALGLEEQLRTLAEIKEVKRLAEKRQQAGGLEIQEGLQLTEKIRALGGQLDLLEERLSEKFKRLQQNEQGIRKDLNPQAITAVAGKLDEIWVLGTLGQLDELVPGKRAQTLGEMKATLKELEKIRKLVDLEKKLGTMGELKKELEEFKEEGELVKLETKTREEVEAAIKKLRAAERGTTQGNLNDLEKKLGEVKSLGDLARKIEDHKLTETLKGEKGGQLKKKLEELAAIKELKALGFRDWLRLRTLEELTEIAEKRGVATVMKAALASAMEIAKNRGWTDYLNSLDVSERANAARELIAAEKIRKWARDINNLDADERAMVAGALTLSTTV